LEIKLVEYQTFVRSISSNPEKQIASHYQHRL
jgi:hypothetical protein